MRSEPISDAVNSARKAPVPTVPGADPGSGRGPEWLDRYLLDRLPALVATRRDIHAHPELGHAESATSAVILRSLRDVGITGTLLPSGTGVVAEIGSGERLVALRADIDALPLREVTGLPFASTVPGVAHACGHDIHTTALIGAAQALASAGDLPGSVRLIWQPAEEMMPGGSEEVIASGALAGVERIFTIHCDPRLEVGRVGLRVGPITSTSDVIDLRLAGPGGHTARPHLTADLIHAMGMVITGLPSLLTRRMNPRSVPVMVWGNVASGVAANAIPESGTLRGTLRLMDRGGWDLAEPLVREIVGAILAPTGCGFTLDYQRGVPPVENDAVSTEILRAAATTAIGSESIALAEQSTGAEDFATYLDHVPGALARVGVWDGVGPQVDLHSPGFCADERALPVAVRLLALTAMESFDVPR
ncbi:amidohydrolase [Nakamurella sp. UYEF19]|uniref:amidohydrolase n=1 Tax=Nakamurella sp. UYEF19 TaxID=1756392 RepID=UPI0033983DC2